MKLLIVEDDLLLQRGLEKALVQEGYVLDIAGSLQSATAFLTNAHTLYSAIILDLGLPDGNGMSLLASLRAQKNMIPILIVTARDAVNDRIIGLDAGADDYLIKPFALTELYARLRAIIRRHNGQANNNIEIAGFSLDLANRSISFEEASLDLTPREYGVLSRLLLKFPNIVPRELLMQDLYSWQDPLGSNTLEVYVHRLRQKIGKARILTVRGFGYQLVEKHEP